MADATAKFESAQAFFCAIADYVGSNNIDRTLNLKKYPEYRDFKNASKKHQDIVKKSLKRIDTPGVSSKEIEKFLNDDVTWYQSSVLIAVKLIKDLYREVDTDFRNIMQKGFQDLYYFRGDADIMGNIDSIFKIANNNTKYFQMMNESRWGNINKWSPADIYYANNIAKKAIKEELVWATKHPGSYNIGNLNILMNELLAQGFLLPLSLKKQTKNVVLELVNFSPSTKEKLVKEIHYQDHWNNEKKTGKWYKPPKRRSGLPIGKTDSRDILIGVANSKGVQKGYIQMRHDPSGSSWKVDFKYKGAEARGGSVVSHVIFSDLLKMVSPSTASAFLSEYVKGEAKFKQQMRGPASKDKVFNNNFGYFGMKGLEAKKPVLKKIKWLSSKSSAFDYQRGELSAVTIINKVMPILVKWLKSATQKEKTQFVRIIYLYVTSRSNLSGRFVIAK